MERKSFASDNYAGIHPVILEAIQNANNGHTKAYGDDSYTEKALMLFKKHFGEEVEAYFVLTGTAANVLGIQALAKSHQAVICAETAHINVDECGAPEKYTGCKLLTVVTSDGKLRVQSIKKLLLSLGNQHRVQPKIISITQATELGTVYSPDEIRKISEFAHANELYVHMDGSRLCNAAAYLNVELISLTKELGIDVLSFGGTKNGMMLGEAVLFFNPELSKDFKYIRKQGMQLASKMRFIAAQFIALLSNDLWLKNAQQANAMAKLLAEEVKNIPHVKISRETNANAVFAFVEPKIIALLQKKYNFYVWDETRYEVRWMTSFNTTKKDILDFVSCMKEISL